MDAIGVLYAALAGALSGLVYAGSSYLKAWISAWTKDGKGEAFDYEKVAATLVIGLIVGVVAGYLGVAYEVTLEKANLWFGTIGGIVVVEQLVKAAYRWIKKRLRGSTDPSEVK